MKYIDFIYKISLVLIALFNILFALYIFKFKNKKNEKEKESDRKIELLKTLILDHNMSSFYSIIEKIEMELKALKSDKITDNIKKEIESKVADQFILLRRNFYDSLLAIDDKLYENIKDKSDDLQTHLTEAIFDQGVNLSHKPKYDEIISQEITTKKTEIIKLLFNYRG